MEVSKNVNLPNGGDAVRHPSRLVSREGEKRSMESRFATLNVGGGMNGKLNDVCQMMDERRIDVLCVNETKRKGCDVTRHGPYTAYWSGVSENTRACQGVGIILSKRMNDCVKEFECLNARILWMRMKVGITRIFVVGVYAPVNIITGMSQNEQEEREDFWMSIRDVLGKCKENEKVIMLGDFNAWVGVQRDEFKKTLGKYGDDSVNENGKRLLEVCLEWHLCVTNTMFEHKRIHMYTREARNVRKSMIDFVIVNERLRKNILDTRVYRGIGIHTDHYLVISRISGLFKKWRYRKQSQTCVLERIKVENLQEELVKDEYKSKLMEKFERLNNVNDLEGLWMAFKNDLISVACEVCGVIKRRKSRKLKNVWWDKEVQEAVCKKKQAWLDWLSARANERAQGATNEYADEAKRRFILENKIVKGIVRRKKEEQKDEFERRLSSDFSSNVKFFWKSIRAIRGNSDTSELKSIRDKNGMIVNGEECVLKRWREYFESLFERDASVRIDADMKDSGDAGCISSDEIVKALNGMKLGKAAGYDRITAEMLKAGQGIVISQIYRLFNLCWQTGQVPSDWCKAVIVPLYKGKGSQQDCKNYRGISLLSIVGKLYAKVLIERVVKDTDEKIWDVQAGFRKGMGCTDQVFSLRAIAEKCLAKGQKVYCAFVDLEKAYDKVVRSELWSVLSMYGVNSNLIRALKSLYRNSSACVRINGAYTDWFSIDKGVRQGCVASPWLFNLYMDNCLKDLKDSDCGLRMNELLVKCLLYADDQVLLASSAGQLQEMVTVMYGAFDRRGMKMNVSKTKVMVFEKDECMTVCDIVVDGERVEQVKEFVYLGTLFTRDGKYEKDIERRVNAGNKVNGALRAFMASQNVSKKARLAVHRGVLVPTLMYGSESWVWQKSNESKINAVEMRALRSMCGVTLRDRIRNSVIRERCGVKVDIVTRIEKGMLSWFGHIERMNEERLTKRVYKAGVNGTVGRGRPRRTFYDQVKGVLEKGQVKSTVNRRACMRNLMKVEEARDVCQDRSKWKSIVSAYPSGKQA